MANNRKAMNQAWRQNLHRITQSNSFQNVLKRLYLTDYQRSSSGGTMLRVAVQESILNAYNKASYALLHAIESGLNFVIINKSEQVCAFCYLIDMCDLPTTSKENDETPLNILKNTLLSQSKLYKKYINMNHKYSFGEFIYDGIIMVKPDMLRLKLGNICAELSTVLAVSVGYKLMKVVTSHPMTIKNATKMSLVNSNAYFECEFTNFSNIILSNGVHMSDYYEKLKKRRGLSDKMMQKIKKDSIWGITFTHFDNMKSKYEDPFERAMELWQHRANIFFRTKSSDRSRL
eukprot:682305_1